MVEKMTEDEMQKLMRKIERAERAKKKVMVVNYLREKRTGTIEEIKESTGLESEELKSILSDCETNGILQVENGIYSIGPRLSEYEEQFAKFVIMDQKLKKIMYDWQGKTIGDQYIINDHTDREYDFSVLERLFDIDEKLRNLLKGEEIYKELLSKLEYALQQVESGDYDWMAKYTIDSYHTVWIQIHEMVADMAAKEYVEAVGGNV